MTEDHFNAVLEVLLSRRPFEVFTIEQYGGRLLEIDFPGAVLFFQGLGAFTAPGGVLILFDHESVRSIVDAPSTDVPSGPNR